mmetsp:Transcript_32480/g.30960  ORF Transcript_32480/g.30960 Transcript_32480/m.30960 type:complete len:85 (-) Transcript_32480:690-944(-)|eukprot:CAMPEP_0119043536 /NCGR_PEP_ID=MMETSP1177-20130426/23175_1 /TAXON_ID=2985 /ORGANISM="Ochromonas sp, Strain CCMP1899" /LENGTH=84 /DNA_ID=CAMNT_0007011839 /DNA_START=161 /DNA_END=415 /DNA_ORIENTATION=-
MALTKEDISINDWDNREMIQVIQLKMLKLMSFLNQFDMTMKQKLTKFDEKLNRLEKSVEFYESNKKSCLNSNDNKMVHSVNDSK